MAYQCQYEYYSCISFNLLLVECSRLELVLCGKAKGRHMDPIRVSCFLYVRGSALE